MGESVKSISNGSKVCRVETNEQIKQQEIKLRALQWTR